MRDFWRIAFGAVLVSGNALMAQTNNAGTMNFRPRPTAQAEAMADSVLSQMTLEEKIAYIGGDRHFFIRPIPRLGLREVFMSDATEGVHIRDSFRDINLKPYALERSTAFPCPICLAATWNPALAYEYAEAIGEECRTGGIGILLGPGMNAYRTSQCGRNFEYFGEDPFLRARLIEEYVLGLQGTGTVATLKHFVANNTEFYRRRSNSVVDNRALHEIYLPPFEAGIAAGAKAVMTSYNLLNGEWCGQSSTVIHDILRGQLGFSWLVMTDWESVYDGEKLVKSGQDIEMPGAEALKDVRALLDEGKIAPADIDRMVRSILRTYFAMRLDERTSDSSFYDRFRRHQEVALRTAREGIVLLKNEGKVLPLIKGAGRILLTGTFVDSLAAGGGSAAVKGYAPRLMIDELKKEFGEAITFIRNPTPAEIQSADAVICNVGTRDSEGWDRPFALPEDQEGRVLMCVQHNPRTIVVVTSGSGVRMTDWAHQAKAIVYAWYGGQEGNTALAEVISGKINPSGRLPMTIEKEFRDSPGHDYLPAGERLYSGWPEGREREHPVYDVHYTEGIFVGYRWFEKQNIEPLFPFGYGLSYTTFGYSDLSISCETFSENDTVTAKFVLRNTGARAGAEVAQLYVQEMESPVPRPIKELKGFHKVSLEPGRQATVELRLGKRAFAHWDSGKKAWVADKGKYAILVGPNSADIKLTGTVELQ
ncbi:MAG TPA: glycoside hydrolase family 3 C-terminal domain-containing protein [Bacteroidota bacterium]|nr:glycoside hydrolase family 3 C-terminal domain-containing protein [Bacteroidota bacterium]